MKSRYLLDTNIFAELLKPNPTPSVLAEIEKNSSEICTASIVVHEILFGCLRLPIGSKRRADIQLFIDNVILPRMPIFDYNIEAALWHAEQRAKLSLLGKTPAFADGQIASIVVTNNLILVTRNVTDFLPFEGLIVDNWFR